MALISGRVCGAKNREGLNDVRIVIESAPCEVGDIAALSWNDGNFELDVPASGDYKLKFMSEGYRTTIVYVLVPGSVKELEVLMEVEE